PAVSGVVSIAGAATSVGAGVVTGLGGVGLGVVVVVVGVGDFGVGLGLGAGGAGERRGAVCGAELEGVGSDVEVAGEGDEAEGDGVEGDGVEGGEAAGSTREASCGEPSTCAGALRATTVGGRRGAGALGPTRGFTSGFGFGRAVTPPRSPDDAGAGSVGSDAPAPAATVVWCRSLLGWAAR